VLPSSSLSQHSSRRLNSPTVPGKYDHREARVSLVPGLKHVATRGLFTDVPAQRVEKCRRNYTRGAGPRRDATPRRRASRCPREGDIEGRACNSVQYRKRAILFVGAFLFPLFAKRSNRCTALFGQGIFSDVSRDTQTHTRARAHKCARVASVPDIRELRMRMRRGASMRAQSFQKSADSARFNGKKKGLLACRMSKEDK